MMTLLTRHRSARHRSARHRSARHRCSGDEHPRVAEGHRRAADQGLSAKGIAAELAKPRAEDGVVRARSSVVLVAVVSVLGALVAVLWGQKKNAT